MPINILQETQMLRSYYNQLGWFQKWFFPQKLATALTNNSNKSFTVYQAFKPDTSWSSRFFSWLSQSLFSGLKRYTQLRTPELARSLKILSEAGLLNDENGETNFVATISHKDPVNLALCLEGLNTLKLLTGERVQANFLKIMEISKIFPIDKILQMLEVMSSCYHWFGRQRIQENFDRILPTTWADDYPSNQMNDIYNYILSAKLIQNQKAFEEGIERLTNFRRNLSSAPAKETDSQEPYSKYKRTSRAPTSLDGIPEEDSFEASHTLKST